LWKKEKNSYSLKNQKKENLPNFKNPKPSMDLHSYYFLKYAVIDSSFNPGGESLTYPFAKKDY
jgi:hypothetical protein